MGDFIKLQKEHTKRIILLEHENTKLKQEFGIVRLDKERHITELDDRTKDLSSFKFSLKKQMEEVKFNSKLDSDINSMKIDQITSKLNKVEEPVRKQVKGLIQQSELMEYEFDRC